MKQLSDAGITEDDQRRIVLNNTMDIGRGKEVLTSETSTSQSLYLMSLVTSSSSILDEIGPLQAAAPKRPSSRGRKPMQSAELASPENRAVLKEKAAAKGAKKPTPQKPKPKKATTKRATPSRAAKRVKPTSPPSDEETDFCIICPKLLPQKLTAANSINCNVCKRPVHLKCANMQANYFTCKYCESDVDDDEEYFDGDGE
ncbi:histone H1.4-like [Anastrepha ludens]|uniref:histone H1.4-like n=1 Tax=Anastrepha ludens TaxID=28586 RepID=UPI0023B0C869|nr:histone H1.4-like [Anastrepha ludens]